MMLGGVVQYQHNRTLIRGLLYQRIEKGDKGITVSLGCWHGNHFIGQEIVGTEQVMPLLFTWRVNTFLRPPFHPASAQHRMQA